MRKQLLLVLQRRCPLPTDFQPGDLLNFYSNTWFAMCEAGHLSAVKWLHENMPPYARRRLTDENRGSYATNILFLSMHDAAMQGHLNVVKFLYENYEERCSLYTAYLVNDHDVVQFILDGKPWPVKQLFKLLIR